MLAASSLERKSRRDPSTSIGGPAGARRGEAAAVTPDLLT